MEMKLQRSTTSFRRQGSSGLIWNDKFLSGDLNLMKKLNTNQGNRGSDALMTRSGSEGHNGRMSVNAASPTIDPPSPKISGCGFCGVLGKPTKKIVSNKHGAWGVDDIVDPNLHFLSVKFYPSERLLDNEIFHQ
ncbi:hypothetical protein CXB51_014978 [Gossypium anomalum]|uniref:MAPK kinase substrate protein n=1 Tax=Gossypium anomalum TaxID=47600 RepID=A0A8J5Z0N0_9ROSI|nr:hypothetical protein CXB51_014978 [Gossypium anomalum]